jgi:hypothetical protein
MKKKTPVSDEFSVSNVYKLTCPDCNKTYVGQTDGSFTARDNGHNLALRNNNHTSGFAHNFNEQVHPFGNIDNTMQIKEYQKKVPTLTRLNIFTFTLNTQPTTT